MPLEGDLAFSVDYFDRGSLTPVPESDMIGIVAAVGLVGLLVHRRFRHQRNAKT